MAAKGYTTLEAVENYLLIDVDPSFVDQVNEWIEVAEAIIDKETDRDFNPGEEGEDGDPEDRLFDGDNTNTLVIPPAYSVESVKLSPTGDAIDEEQYYLYPANKTPKTKIVMPYVKFPRGNQNIVVNAVWGGAVPADIKLAATVIVAGIINRSWSSEGEIASFTIGSYSVSYKTAVQVDDFQSLPDIFARHRRYTV